MFGKKKQPKAAPESAPKKEEKNPASEIPQEKARPGRVHSEGLGDAWVALTGLNPAAIMPQVAGTVLHEGGSRPAWQWKRNGREHILMAWPKDQPVRAAVIMAGEEGGKLMPVTVVPLLEGLANDLEVEEVKPRAEGLGADVAVTMQADENPMWFFDPLYGRDKDDLTPGITHTFLVAGLAFVIRKALLDELTITQGPQYEAHAAQWLQEHPQASRLDVPPLKISMTGKRCIMPGRHFGEYQIRTEIERVEDYRLENMDVKALYLSFPFEDRPPLRLVLYASQYVLGDFAPREGDEIESYAWLEGRIIDFDASAGPEAADGVADEAESAPDAPKGPAPGTTPHQ